MLGADASRNLDSTIMAGSSLDKLFPELFDAISLNIPLYERCSSLSALSLASTHYHGIIVPQLLYRWAVVNAKPRAELLLQNLTEQIDSAKRQTSPTPLGHNVRELHILCDPFEGDGRDVFNLLEALVASRGLINLRFLEICVAKRNPRDTTLQEPFWKAVMQHCRQLRGIRLEGSSDDKIGHPLMNSYIPV
jgi:hypothetical protein